MCYLPRRYPLPILTDPLLYTSGIARRPCQQLFINAGINTESQCKLLYAEFHDAHNNLGSKSVTTQLTKTNIPDSIHDLKYTTDVTYFAAKGYTSCYMYDSSDGPASSGKPLREPLP